MISINSQKSLRWSSVEERILKWAFKGKRVSKGIRKREGIQKRRFNTIQNREGPLTGLLWGGDPLIKRLVRKYPLNGFCIGKVF